MMNCFLFSVICFVLVETHPLIQNVQPYPVTNYHQYVYRQPYSEAFIVQPSKIDQYSQPISVQTPLPTYQTLQGSVTDQLSKIYLENILSNPSLRHLLVSNKLTGNEYSKDMYANTLPYNNREVVNNYIIVPPDDLNVNHTVTKQRKPKRVKNDTIKDRGAIKETNTSKKSKKKVRDNGDNSQGIKSLNKKTRRKVKQNVEKSWSFNTDNIKCFTPADVLENEKYVPEKRTHTEVKKQCRRKKSDKTSKLSANNENVNGLYKLKKPTKNKVKKTPVENGNSKCLKKKENTVTPTKEKSKQYKKEPKARKCTKKDKLPNGDTKISEDTPQTCNQDMNELFLSNLLQQGCISLENRCTRNSKVDTVIKDFHSMYPDLPSDISKSLASYMNDFFSPHSLQNAFSSAPGSKYPFDFSQLYQIPQYPNIAKGSTDTNKKTRRKKKKKKNTKPKAKKENDGSNDDINIQTCGNNYQISDNAVATKTNAQILESNIQVLNKNTEIETHTPHKVSETESESAEKPQDISEEIQTINITPVSPKKNTTDTVIKELIIPKDEDLEYFTKPVQSTIELIKEIKPIIYDEAVKPEEESKEIYETQIPNSISERKNNENYIEELKHEERVVNEILPKVDSNIFNQFSDWGSEDELFNMFLHDYYPDFRADNLAYLVSDEETNLRNIHDRYFYVTDRNIDSREIYSPVETNHLHNTDRGISAEDDFGNHNLFQRRDNGNTANEKGEEEVVFRTPPALDVPDFITRKVNIDKEDSNEIYYRHNLEDNFDRFNLDNFADNSDNHPRTAKRFDDENSGRLVETVYARSKVVKYGQGQEIIKSNKPETKTNSNFDDGIIQNDGEKIVVIAKSLHPEDYW